MKLKLKTKLNNIACEYIGIKTNNKLIYQEEDVTTSIKYTDSSVLLKRVYSDSTIYLKFEKGTNIGKIVLNNKNSVDLEIKTNIISVSENKIEINYELNDEVYDYIVEVGEA